MLLKIKSSESHCCHFNGGLLGDAISSNYQYVCCYQ